jgi:hypothetical protein
VDQQLLLLTRLQHRRDACNQVSSLLPDLRCLIVQAPLDGTTDLGQVGLGALAERVDHSAEAVEHDVGIVTNLRTHNGGWIGWMHFLCRHNTQRDDCRAVKAVLRTHAQLLTNYINM